MTTIRDDVQPLATQSQTASGLTAPLQARQRLFQLALGSLVSQLLYVAAKLGVADLLKDGPKSYSELASATNTHALSLYRVLRALATQGIFTEVEEGHFALTPVGQYLRTDITDSFRVMPIYLGEELYQTFGGLLEGVKTGSPVFDQIFGASYFEYLGQHPQSFETFQAAMTALGNAAETPAVTAAYDFSGIHTVVDVGGGEGSLLASILTVNPKVKGILFDQPPVIEKARPRLSANEVTARCELVGGDFFEAVPANSEVYILKRIIHDWDDERSLAILKNCRNAMPSNGKILIIEEVVPPGDEFSPGKIVDVLMMLILNGRERSTSEYKTLLKSAGFELSRVIPTTSPMSILEARPV